MKYEIKVNKFENDNVRGFATVTFEKKFAVGNIKIIEGKNGLFVAMPSYKNKEGEYTDIAYPVTKEFREQLFADILSEYEKL